MKKLIALVLVLVFAVTLGYADGWKNSFGRTDLGGITLDSRITCYDDNTGEGGHIRAKNLGVTISLDKDDFLVNGVSLGRSGNFEIALETGDVFRMEAIWVGSGFHSSDYVLLSNADSNGTVLDTINLITGGDRTNTYTLQATQDSTLYLLMGDTCSVSSKILLNLLVGK